MKKIILSTVLITPLVAVETKESTYYLNKILTQDNYEYQKQNETFIDAKNIQNKQARNINEVFNDDPSINVGGGGSPVNQKIYVRGLEDTLMRVTIDGIPQTGNALHHQGNTALDPFMFKAVEVSKGSAIASSGPGALAGSIKMTTKDPSDFLKNGEKIGMSANGAYYLNNNGFRGSGSIYGDYKGYSGFLLNYSYQQNKDYYDGKRQLVRSSAYELQNILVKYTQKISANNHLSFSYIYFNDTAHRYSAPNFQPKDNTKLLNHILSRNSFALSYGFNDTSLSDFENYVPKIKLNLYYDERKNKRSKLASNVEPNFYSGGQKLINTGANLDFEHRFDFLTFGYGLNYQTFNTFTLPPLGPTLAGNKAKEYSNIYGGYAQTSIELFNLVASGGIRYDFYNYLDNYNQYFTANTFSPSISLLYAPIEGLNFKISYAFSQRGPQPQEVHNLANYGYSSDAIMHYNYKNSAKLKAESSDTIEFNIDYSNEFFTARTALFHKNIKNFINNSGFSSVGQDKYSTRSNIDEIISIAGYEAGIVLRYKGFSTTVNVAQNIPTIKGLPIESGGNFNMGLGETYGRSWVFLAEYFLKDYNLRFQWASRITEPLKTYSYSYKANKTNILNKKGYDVHDIYINYSPLKSGRLKFDLAFLNIFNTFYVNATSAQGRLHIPDPGFDFRINLRYTFNI